MGSAWYCTREDVTRSLDIDWSSRTNAQADRAIDAASRAVEGLTHRIFAPVTTTKFFDWPNEQNARSWRLWLEDVDLISVTTLSSGGTTIPATDFFLEPNTTGPPYDSIEIDLDSASAFSASGTHQRSVSITGLWGYSNDEISLGVTTEALDATETGVDVDGPTAAEVGVGSVLRIDSERMLVTDRTSIDTMQNIGGNLTSVDNDVTVVVSDGTAFGVDEVILVNSEQMLITDISGNNLTVTRAWNGTTLASHTSGDDVYAYRTLTVERGALGTTAAAHSSGASVIRWSVPGLLRELTMAEAINNILQARAGYARTAGTGDNEREARIRGLEALRVSVRRTHGRSLRFRGV